MGCDAKAARNSAVFVAGGFALLFFWLLFIPVIVAPFVVMHAIAKAKNSGVVITDKSVFMVDCQGCRWSAKMSLVLLAMITDGSYSTRSRFMGGLRASMYFFAVSRWMPSSRATPRVDNPLRFAF